MRSDGQSGIATVEVIIVGLVLIAPLLWFLSVAAEVHRTALAVAAAARDASLDATVAVDLSAADRAVAEAIAGAMTNHGIESRDTEARWGASRGLTRGATIEVWVRHPVRVLRPPLLGDAWGPSIWVRARAAAQIDPFASRP